MGNRFILVNRGTWNALRISLKKDIAQIDPDFAILRKKAFSKGGTEQDKADFEKKKDEMSQKILEIPDEELFKIENVEIEIPQGARIFPSVKCAKCGEMVAEHRARVENGNFVCIPCFEDYSRS